MGSDNVDISFIIPACNSQECLQRCVESILADVCEATLRYEILIVENGSTDNTYDVSILLSRKHDNVRVFKSQKGVSAARNKGIKESKGRKLIFVDADDLWVNGSLNIIRSHIVQFDADLILYGYYKYDKKILYDKSLCNRLIEGKELSNGRSWMISRPNERMTAWAKVLDKDIIVRNNIFFDESLDFSEDSEFLIRYIMECASIFISDFAIYEYTSNLDSVTRSFNLESIENYIISIQKSQKILNDGPDIIKSAFAEYVLINLNILLVHEVFNVTTSMSFRERMKILKDLLQKEPFNKALSDVSLSQCLTSQLFPELLIKCHMSFPVSVMFYFRSYRNFRKYKKTASGRFKLNP